MQRHMQNISFLTIVGVLLSCAFFFSQQTNADQAEVTPQETATGAAKVETLADLPDCGEGSTGESDVDCYTDAAALSERLMDDQVDAILSMEADSGKRIAFMETQLTWEESRDADCDYVRDLADSDQQEIAELVCLRDHNLERLSQLEATCCEFYDASTCSPSESVTP